MKIQNIVAVTFGAILLSNGANSALATSTKHRAKSVTTSKAKSKIVVKSSAKTPVKAKTSGPRFVDGVMIMDNSGGEMSLGNGATRVQTLNRGTRASANSAARTATTSTQSAAVSSTRNANPPTQTARKRIVPPQFTSVAMDGNSISLSQYRGRVVLLDFWATWCPPCRDEAPQIVQIYNKYHRQGLEIVGASFDHDADAVENFTRANGMTWRQIFGGKDWDSDLAKIYGVNSIPNSVLIARDGTVLGIGLHGQNLERAIQYGLSER